MTFLSTQIRQSVLAALADQEIVKILDCSMFRDKSVNEVIRECNIPHTTAYRKIRWLLDNGLLLSTRNEVTEEGKKFTLFRSVFKSLRIDYEYGNIAVFADYNIDPVEKVTERLLSLR
jgi:predicted transcriptional regulator